MNIKLNINIYLYIIIGFAIGVFFFIFFENMKHGNTFNSNCWIRKQPGWMTHGKVYIIGLLLIYSELRGCKNPINLLIGSVWIGVHLSQDLAERYHIKKFSDI